MFMNLSIPYLATAFTVLTTSPVCPLIGSWGPKFMPFTGMVCVGAPALSGTCGLGLSEAMVLLSPAIRRDAHGKSLGRW